MSNQTMFKLKQHITKDDLGDAGFLVIDSGAIRGTVYGDFIYIPLRESSRHGYRVIQYAEVNTIPEDLNLDDIEDLVTRGWVEKIKNEHC